MVVFVGDKPSRLNDDPEIAFIGTPSYRNLLEWIVKMKIGSFTMVNSYTHEDSVKICRLWNVRKERKFVFVSLGVNAGKRLERMRIKHFKLPHPSPRNRMLNDKANIDFQLEKCYLYLKEQKECVSFVPSGKRVS